MELNLRKNKWLLFGSHHPPSQSDKYFFNPVKYGLDIYSKCYDKYMLIRDFKVEESEPCLSNPSCIDLVITNSSSNFQNTQAISMGISDFHKMVVSVLKHTFHRSAPKELVYRDYKNFDRVIFKRELEDKLNQQINTI